MFDKTQDLEVIKSKKAAKKWHARIGKGQGDRR